MRRFSYCAAIGLLLLAGCKGAPAPSPRSAPAEAAKMQYPPRPSVPAPSVKVVHQDEDTYTLVTRDNASDEEVEAILWQFRDAAEHHSFDTLHLSQKFIDARKPKVWFHVYRGAKCANEKYVQGKYPCGASYHGAGDFTLGSYTDRDFNEAILHTADGKDVSLWDADAPAAPAAGKR